MDMLQFVVDYLHFMANVGGLSKIELKYACTSNLTRMIYIHKTMWCVM